MPHVDPHDPQLPLPFVWTRIFPEGLERTDVDLRWKSATGPAVATVACMCDRWHVTVNLHRGSHQVRGAWCANRAQGMRWVARWLQAHASRIASDAADLQERIEKRTG